MKTENILILVGLGFIGYWLLKKKNKIINVDDVKDINPDSLNKPKTIVINLNDKKSPRVSMSRSFYDDFRGSGYDTSKFATVSPPMVTVKNPYL